MKDVDVEVVVCCRGRFGEVERTKFLGSVGRKSECSFVRFVFGVGESVSGSLCVSGDNLTILRERKFTIADDPEVTLRMGYSKEGC